MNKVLTVQILFRDDQTKLAGIQSFLDTKLTTADLDIRFVKTQSRELIYSIGNSEIGISFSEDVEKSKLEILEQLKNKVDKSILDHVATFDQCLEIHSEDGSKPFYDQEGLYVRILPGLTTENEVLKNLVFWLANRMGGLVNDIGMGKLYTCNSSLH